MRASVSVRSVAQTSASPGAMPKAGSPIARMRDGRHREVSRAAGGRRRARRARAAAGTAPQRATTPVSGCEACAVLPASAMRMPRDAQLTGPAASHARAEGDAGHVVAARRRESGAISPKRGIGDDRCGARAVLLGRLEHQDDAPARRAVARRGRARAQRGSPCGRHGRRDAPCPASPSGAGCR